MNTDLDRKIAVILVADVVGYSKHMESDENTTNACLCVRGFGSSTQDVLICSVSLISKNLISSNF